MTSDNKKHQLMFVLGLYIVLTGIRRFHFLPLENNFHSFSYSLGNNVGLICRVLLGSALLTKGIFFLKRT